MSTRLSRYARWQHNQPRLPDVASRCGYKNILLGRNRIQSFEDTGLIYPDLYRKRMVTLDLDMVKCDQLPVHY